MARCPQLGELGDQLAVQVGPRRLAVQQQDGSPSGRPGIDVVHPKRADVIGDVDKSGLPRIVRQLTETRLGGRQHLAHACPSPTPTYEYS